MKYLGIDYGSKWVGIAISDKDGQFAFPRETWPNDASLLAKMENLIKDEHIEHVVVGETRTLGGEANTITADAEKFVEDIKKNVRVPIDSIFEAWSSSEADRYAPQGKTHDDASAAAIILQRFLDMKRGGIQ